MASPAEVSRLPGMRAQAEVLDREDSLRHLRDEFYVPTKADIRRKTFPAGGEMTPCFRGP